MWKWIDMTCNAGCALIGMLHMHGFNADKPASAKHAYEQADAILTAREGESDE